MRFSPAVREYLLAFADDEHMIGARHTAWIGLGPFLEEDLAFCSIAQDELGHAIGLYEMLLDDTGDAGSNDLDAFALLRPSADYRSCWLAEARCDDWNDSLVRHWLYDRAETLRWDVLAACPDPEVAAVAERARREEAFHGSHAEQLMARLAATDASGHVADSIGRLVPVAAGLWDPVAGEAEAVDDGFVLTSSVELSAQWEDLVRDDLQRWGFDVEWPPDREMVEQVAAQHHRTARSPDFDELQADLQRVLVLDPTAVW